MYAIISVYWYLQFKQLCTVLLLLCMLNGFVDFLFQFIFAIARGRSWNLFLPIEHFVHGERQKLLIKQVQQMQTVLVLNKLWRKESVSKLCSIDQISATSSFWIAHSYGLTISKWLEKNGRSHDTWKGYDVWVHQGNAPG